MAGGYMGKVLFVGLAKGELRLGLTPWAQRISSVFSPALLPVALPFRVQGTQW